VARTKRHDRQDELGAMEQEATVSPRDNNLDEKDDNNRPSERPASDQPSHGNSLAKMKLFAKTERK
jgi:hypothetical protein